MQADELEAAALRFFTRTRMPKTMALSSYRNRGHFCLAALAE
jgi:hypothetical protein